MAVVPRLPTEDFLSDKYMDTFYKAHVASKTRGSIDDDIAAIEAEIKKVRRYQSNFKRCKYDRHLNSCGSSECSDVDDLDTSSESSMVSASVFKVSNCTPEPYRSVSPSSSLYGAKEGTFVFPRRPDVFTWAVTQQITHDHGYCKPETLPSTTLIERGTVSMKNVPWHTLDSPQRAQAVLKLSCILQHRPSGRQSPIFSSFDLLPTSLANSIRKTGNLGLTHSVSGQSMHKPVKAAPLKATQKLPSTNSVGIKEVKGRERTAHQKPVSITPKTEHTAHKQSKASTAPVRTRSKRATRHSPYTTRHSEVVTRMRNVSSCSEGDDPVVID